MAQEEKQLLLQDLCARLPYGVIVEATYKDGEGWKTEDRKLLGIYEDGQVYLGGVYTTIDNVKPYLRPMSSMTEEEKEEYCFLQDILLCSSQYPVTDAYAIFDWLIAHHFDFRGLIEKEFALEAPEDMYK